MTGQHPRVESQIRAALLDGPKTRAALSERFASESDGVHVVDVVEGMLRTGALDPVDCPRGHEHDGSCRVAYTAVTR